MVVETYEFDIPKTKKVPRRRWGIRQMPKKTSEIHDFKEYAAKETPNMRYTHKKVAINNWLDSPESQNGQPVYRWIGDVGMEPPHDWMNRDIAKINAYYRREIESGRYKANMTAICREMDDNWTQIPDIDWHNYQYETYEDWFSDNYAPINNRETVAHFLDAIADAVASTGFKFKKNHTVEDQILQFIYHYSQ